MALLALLALLALRTLGLATLRLRPRDRAERVVLRVHLDGAAFLDDERRDRVDVPRDALRLLDVHERRVAKLALREQPAEIRAVVAPPRHERHDHFFLRVRRF